MVGNNRLFLLKKYSQKTFFSETLRKYPIATQLSRVCENNYRIEKWNLTVEKGVLVVIPTSVFNMDPDIFPNPEVFDPDRFAPEQIESRHSMAFLPFGKGGRTCIGKVFGTLMLKLTIVELLRYFRFSPCSETDIPMKFIPTQINVPFGKMFLRINKL